MNNFKTVKEMMEALLDGKKIRHKGWGKEEYTYLSKDGSCFYDGKGDLVEILINSYSGFSIYEDPKKKTTLYNYIYKNSFGDIFESGFSSRKWEHWSVSALKLLKTETKEIEVDDE